MNLNKFEWVSYRRDFVWDRLPVRSTKCSAGYDFFAPTVIIIEPHETTSLMFTDIKVQLDKDKVLMLFPRSSMGMKGISLANTTGIIDSDYYNNKSNEGNIGFSLVNNSDKQIVIQKGEKFMQGVIVKYYITDDDNTKGKREGGFGSTDDKAKKTTYNHRRRK